MQQRIGLPDSRLSEVEHLSYGDNTEVSLPGTLPQLRFLQTASHQPDLHLANKRLRYVGVAGVARSDALGALSQLYLLRSLSVTNAACEMLPSLTRLASLQTLDLRRCHLLTQLPSLAGLTSLQSINLSGCKMLAVIPQLEELSKLHTLDLAGCNALEALPLLCGLSALRTLNLAKCGALKSLPLLHSGSGLQSLDLMSCPEGAPL